MINRESEIAEPQPIQSERSSSVTSDFDAALKMMAATIVTGAEINTIADYGPSVPRNLILSLGLAGVYGTYRSWRKFRSTSSSLDS